MQFTSSRPNQTNATAVTEKYKDNYKETCGVYGTNCDDSVGKGQLKDSSRYTYYARSGTGMQKLGPKAADRAATTISEHDKFITGGFNKLDTNELGNYQFVVKFRNETGYWGATDRKRVDFSSSSAPGDSGSAIYAYDNKLGQWFVIGVVSTSNCNIFDAPTYTCTEATYGLINEALIEDFKTKYSTPILTSGTYTLGDGGLKKGQEDMGAHVITGDIKGEVTFPDYNNRNKFT